MSREPSRLSLEPHCGAARRARPRFTVHRSPFTRAGSRLTAHGSRTGFTLLEVIVATAIMAIAIIGLFGLINQSLSNAARVREYDRAAMLARTQMNELIALDKPPLGDELRGAIDDHTGWQASITPWEVPSSAGVGSSFLARIDLKLWWESGGKRKEIELEGFRRVRATGDMDLRELASGRLF